MKASGEGPAAIRPMPPRWLVGPAARLQRERRNAAHLQRVAALSGNVWQRLALRQAQCKREGRGCARLGRGEGWGAKEWHGLG